MRVCDRCKDLDSRDTLRCVRVRFGIVNQHNETVVNVFGSSVEVCNQCYDRLKYAITQAWTSAMVEPKQ